MQFLKNKKIKPKLKDFYNYINTYRGADQVFCNCSIINQNFNESIPIFIFGNKTINRNGKYNFHRTNHLVPGENMNCL